MKRIYLDFNSTSPVAPGLFQFLDSCNYLNFNASSQHTSGKNSYAEIRKSSESIFNHFQGIDKNEYSLYFNSGSTESINTVFNLTSKEALIYFISDHPSVTEVAKCLYSRGVKVFAFDIDKTGQFDIELILKTISECESSGLRVWLNFTWMHNETGVVWPLELIRTLKESTQCKVHVDATQGIGKIINYQKLSNDVDVYSFSGHKFGSLKGSGFTFYKKDLDMKPIILGGGQQKSLRSGTLNTHGVASIEFALNQISKNKILEVQNLKNELIKILDTHEKLSIIKNESSNTICIIHKELKADMLLIHCDMLGLDVSSGSACSSGSQEESSTLKSMGFNELSKNSIRISLGFSSIDLKDEIIKKMKEFVAKI